MPNDKITTETGLSWQPTMRQGWELKPIKAMLTRQSSRVGESSATLTLLSLTKKGVVVRDLSQMKGKFASSMDSYQHVSEGDFVFCLFDVKETPRTVGQSRYAGMITGAYKVLRPIDFSSARFLEYLFISIDDSKGFEPLYRGLRKTLPFEIFRGIKLAIPPPAEKNLIVRYLDHAEIRIANALQAKQRMIALLVEQKQVIINDLVIRGLEHGSPMKKSDIPFLPQIPIGWDVRPTGRALELVTDKNKGDTELLSVYLNRGVIKYTDSAGQVHKPSSNLSSYQIVEVGDFVMNNQQAWRGSVGVSKHRGMVSPAYVVARFRETVDSDYMNFQLRSQIMVGQLEMASRGVGTIQRQLNIPFLKKTMILFPPLGEQREIASIISKRVTGIDSAITAIQGEIDLLKEYRKVLISHVVTGRKDVQEEAASLTKSDPVELALVLAGGALVDAEGDEQNGTSEIE